MRALCDEHGILMVCDEVMAGFGRTGKLFGFMHAPGVIPDIVVSGEGLPGGRREADLPRAFHGGGNTPAAAKVPVLEEKNCPSAGVGGKDKLLGCAVMRLKAGSQNNFFALIGVRKSL